MRKHETLLRIYAMSSSVFILLLYFRLTMEDGYFMYWDPYMIKPLSEKVGEVQFFQSILNDPLFFYNVRIFHEITGVDYYFIIKHGKFLFISFLFLTLYLFFRQMNRSEENSDKSCIIASLTYFFLCYYSYVRFSMTLRENLAISLGFMFAYLLHKYQSELSREKVVLLSIIYSYVIASHILVAFFVSGTLALFISDNLIRKKNMQKMILFIILPIFMSWPFIYNQTLGISHQLFHGQDTIRSEGFRPSYFYLNYSYFSLLDPLIFSLGAALFIRKLRNEYTQYKVFSFFAITVLSFLLLSYLPQVGLKQNRSAIYIYIILSFLLFHFLKGLKHSSMRKILLPLTFLAIVIIPCSRVLDYHGYRPINEATVNYIKSKISYLHKYDRIACGPSVLVAMNYLGYENRSVSFEDFVNENVGSLRILDRPIIITSDDYYVFRYRSPRVFEKFEELKEQNVCTYDKQARMWLIMPD